MKVIIDFLIKHIGKILEWINKNKGALALGGVAGGAAVAVVAQEQKKKAVNKAFKEGCELTAKEYEQKLKEQAEHFLAVKQVLQQDIKEYESLMRDYENEIARLQLLEEKSKEENEVLKSLVKDRKKLMKLKKVG